MASTFEPAFRSEIKHHLFHMKSTVDNYLFFILNYYEIQLSRHRDCVLGHFMQLSSLLLFAYTLCKHLRCFNDLSISVLSSSIELKLVSSFWWQHNQTKKGRWKKGRVETSGSQDLEGHTDLDWKQDAKKRVWPPARQTEGEAAGLPVCWDSAAAENSESCREFSCQIWIPFSKWLITSRVCEYETQALKIQIWGDLEPPSYRTVLFQLTFSLPPALTLSSPRAFENDIFEVEQEERK